MKKILSVIPRLKSVEGRFESIGIIGQDFVTDALFNQNLTLATADNQFIEQSYNRQDLQSYFGRANYNLMDKYHQQHTLPLSHQ